MLRILGSNENLCLLAETIVCYYFFIICRRGTKSTGKTQAEVGVAVQRREAVPARHAAAPRGVVVPTAAAKHAVRARRGTGRIRYRSCRTGPTR